MSDKKIYIFNSTKTDIVRLTDLFREEGHELEVRSKIPSSGESFPHDSALVYLFDYESIAQSGRDDIIRFFQQITQHNIVVYNVPENANRRMAFYDLGARRVFDRSFELDEIFYGTRWLIESLSKGKEEDALFSRGRLEDIPLATLIGSLGQEKRTGILKLITPKSSGKIYFNQGHIDDAWVNGHGGEEAVLHMLYWNKGNFYFSAADSVRVKKQIALSNIALVLLAEQRRDSFAENLKKIGPYNSTLRAVHVGDIRALHPDIDEAFIRIIQKPRMLEEALENPVYTCYKTAEKLVVLKEENLLEVNSPHKKSVFEAPLDAIPSVPAALDEIILNRYEIQQLKINLKIEGENTGKIVVLGSRLSGKSEFIQRLTRAKTQLSKAKDLEVARVTLSTDLDLLLFGMTVDQMVMETTEKLSEGLVGYIFFVSFLEQDTYEYTNYIINHLLSIYPVSCVIGVTDLPSPDLLDSVRKKFQTQYIINWVPCKAGDMRSIHDVLLAMEPVTLPKKEDEKEGEEQEENVSDDGKEENSEEIIQE